MSLGSKPFSRRHALTGAAAITAAGVASCKQSNAKEIVPDATPPKKDLVLDYKNPKWNRDAIARIHGNIDFSKEKLVGIRVRP